MLSLPADSEPYTADTAIKQSRWPESTDEMSPIAERLNVCRGNCRYSDKTEVAAQIERLGFLGGETNTLAALNVRNAPALLHQGQGQRSIFVCWLPE